MHRDIKPENVLLSGDGGALLTDFGLALDTAEQVPGARVGTIDYLAPEVSNGVYTICAEYPGTLQWHEHSFLSLNKCCASLCTLDLLTSIQQSPSTLNSLSQNLSYSVATGTAKLLCLCPASPMDIISQAGTARALGQPWITTSNCWGHWML